MDKIRILIADDVPEIRTLLRITLEREDPFEVVGEAANGQEAVELSEELQPDVVLLDLAMPVMDGLQAIPAVHSVCSARILVFSGFDEGNMERRALAATASAYLSKGVSHDEIVERVAAVAAVPPKGSN